ncbi:WD40-repeat-containing domain [Trinorchestia longiramus]|nr:WD40-repeat-containing domain [Trinorchestia longiramus]
MEDQKMSSSEHIFVGTDTGFIKGIQFTSIGAKVQNYRLSKKLDSSNAVTALAWRDEGENEIFIGHRDSTVSLFDTRLGSSIFRHRPKVGSGKVVDIVERKGHVLVGMESGHICHLFKGEKKDQIRIDTLCRVIASYKDKPKLGAVKIHPTDDNKIATGGCENDLKIWDIENTRKPVYSAKNVAHDFLNLRQPIWVSDLTFLEDNLIVVTSRHKYVRLYDPRVRPRPILTYNYEQSPLTTVSTAFGRERQVVLGTAHGRVALFDLRKNHQVRAPVCFKGINGAVKQVLTLPSDPALAYSVSLDRYLRVHNIETKETLHQEYLKSRLTRVLVRSP